MKDEFFSSVGSINRLHFIARFLLFIAVPFIVTLFAMEFFSHWHHGTHYPLGIFIGLIVSLIALFSITMQAIKRLNDLGKSPIFSLLIAVPVINICFILFLMLAPSKGH